MKLFQVLKLTVPNSRGSAIEIQTIYLGDSSETAISKMEEAKQEESGNGVSYLIQSVNAEVKEKEEDYTGRMYPRSTKKCKT